MRLLDHENIIKLHEVYEDDQNYYLVIDYLKGFLFILFLK